MELLTHKEDHTEYTYYLDKKGHQIAHGEYRDYYNNGTLWEHTFRYHWKRHGEFKTWGKDGRLLEHCFYINGIFHPYVEMNAQEKLLFQIQHPGFRFFED